MPDEQKKAEPAAGEKKTDMDNKNIPDCIILDDEVSGPQTARPDEVADALESVSASAKETARKITETYSELFPSMNETMQEAVKAASQAMSKAYNPEIIQASLNALKKDAEKIDKIFASEEWKQLTEIFPDLTDDGFLGEFELVADRYDQDGHATIDGYLKFFDELAGLLPYIPKVLDAYKKRSGMQAVTFRQFLESKDAAGEPATSLFERCAAQMRLKENYAVLPHTTGTDVFASVVATKAVFRDFMYEHKSGDIILRAKIKGGVSTHKLLSYANILFSSANHTGKYENLIFRFSLEEYARICGVDIVVRGKNNPRREKFVQQVKDDIVFLKAGKLRDSGNKFAWISPIANGAVSADEDLIYISLAPDYALELSTAPLTQYPLALFRIDGRKKNTYIAGLRLAEQYARRGAVAQSRNDVMRVSTLLEHLTFPKETEIKKSHWKARVQKPFEKCMDELVEYGVLEKWQYRGAKKKVLSTDVLATQRSDIKTWKSLYISFSMPCHAPAAQLTARPRISTRNSKKLDV